MATAADKTKVQGTVHGTVGGNNQRTGGVHALLELHLAGTAPAKEAVLVVLHGLERDGEQDDNEQRKWNENTPEKPLHARRHRRITRVVAIEQARQHT